MHDPGAANHLQGRKHAGTRLVLWGVGGIVVILLILTFLVRRLVSPVPEEPDTANLLTENSSFEEEGPRGTIPFWRLDRPGRNRMEATPAQRRHLKKSLMIEKASDPDSFALECQYTKEIDVRRIGSLTARAWYRADPYRGFFAFKITWFSSSFGRPLLEEVSPVKLSAYNWEEVAAVFQVPPGAETAQFSLICFGKDGQIFVDYVRLYGTRKSSLSKEMAMQDYRIRVSPNGASMVRYQERNLLVNVTLALSGKHGRSAQTLAQAGGFQSSDREIRGHGEIYDPNTLRGAPYDEVWSYRDGWLEVRYIFSHAIIGVFTRYTVQLTLPGSEHLPGVVSSEDFSQATFSTAGGQVQTAVRFSKTIKSDVRESERDGLLTLTGELSRELSPADPKTVQVVWAVKVSDLSRTETSEDVLRGAREADRNQKYGLAIRLYRQVLDRFPRREDALEVEKRIQEILDLEAAEWEKIQQKAVEAELSFSQAAAVEAAALLRSYQSRFQESAREEAKALADRMDRLVYYLKVRFSQERPKHLLAQAEGYINAGKIGLAAEFLEVLVAYYKDSPEAERARELLRRIKK